MEYYNRNLRLARATDTYVLKGAIGVEVFGNQKFTYIGFQMLSNGFPGKPPYDAITGLVLSSIETNCQYIS